MKKKNPFPKHFNRNAFFGFLTSYVLENYEEWKKSFLNISGVHIGRKMIKGRETNRYAIIFHVIVKTDLIQTAEKIPKKITVVYNGIEKMVPTDVIFTGESELQHIAPGRNVMQFNNSSKRGSMGLIVFKDDHPHLLSNMHVLGWSYLPHSHMIIDKPIDTNTRPDINTLVDQVLTPVGYFRSGIVDNRIDAAIAIIPPKLFNKINERKDIFSLRDPIMFPPKPIKQPIPVRMLGAVSGFMNSEIVSVMASKTFNYPFGERTIDFMIALRPCCSQPGDSGSPVYEPESGRIIGIIVGRDQNLEFSFVIPYPAIQSAFHLQLI
ncbi:hypothetical protein [Pedobacter sp. Hv1]|uniref:hypothetical protein n=1 Tax=Pedobacter sp. Hv1 TaxID=1740090 RepID=UPI0006D8A0E3|nr:hypothetical protein [Pedobacter sp. Hv1]KQB99203.1 hypothetical protein AQF98_16625 [Pedobacter sp. Hv1]